MQQEMTIAEAVEAEAVTKDADWLLTDMQMWCAMESEEEQMVTQVDGQWYIGAEQMVRYLRSHMRPPLSDLLKRS